MNRENIEIMLADRKPIADKVSVPSIRLDYEVKVNQNLFETLSYFNRWLKKYMTNTNYMELNMYDFCVYMAYCYPDATTKQLLCISQAMTWAFVCDDMVMEKFKTYEEAMTYVNEHMRIWDTQDLKQAREFCTYCEIIMNAYQLVSEQFSPRQKERFRSGLIDYLEGSAEENFLRSGNVSVDYYIRLRRKANGSAIFLLFAEMESGCDMSSYIEDDIFKLNEDMIHLTVAIINDLYSYNREQTFEASSNLVYQIKVNEKISGQKALDEGTNRFFSWVNTYETTSKQLVEKFPGNKGITKYLKCLDYWLQGNCIWNLYSIRYAVHNGIDFVF